MSGNQYNYELENEYDTLPSPASGQKQLAGAHRASANPRLHALQKPYSRPVSYSGPIASGSMISASPIKHDLFNGNGHGNVNGHSKTGSTSPTKQPAPTTRPILPSSQSARSLPRSGSDSSLFGSLKGLISKPLSWLATPRASKRDQSTWNAGRGRSGSRKSQFQTDSKAITSTPERSLRPS
jgi:nucleoporin NUP1